jgi:hypothetical protein
VSRPVIEVSTDQAGGIVLSTSDRWLIEDATEQIAKTISSHAFVGLSVALDEFEQNDNRSLNRLDLSRALVGSETVDKSIVLARLLPFEILSLIRQLNDAMEKSA